MSRESYRVQFDLLANQNGWDDGQRSVQLATSLKGAAQEVLSLLSVDDCSCYSSLVEVLERRYGTTCLREVYRVLFRICVRARGESLQQLAQKILAILLKEQFIDALGSAELKVQVKQAQPYFMQEALLRALEFELYVWSNTTFVRPEMLQHRDLPESLRQLCGITRYCTELRGPVDVLIEVSGQKVVLPFYVVEMEYPCLLGLDYLVSVGCKLDFYSIKLWVKIRLVPVMVVKRTIAGGAV
uniref:Uncharacterized protein n=1 Tax=Octopus bimaculoides TaxID=37653 RepID=A0A0L8H2Y9_OCTBM